MSKIPEVVLSSAIFRCVSQTNSFPVFLNGKDGKNSLFNVKTCKQLKGNNNLSKSCLMNTKH